MGTAWGLVLTRYHGYIADGDALDMEVHRFRIIYNTIRPHQGLADRTPKQAYLDDGPSPKTCQLLDSRQVAPDKPWARQGRRGTVPTGARN